MHSMLCIILLLYFLHLSLEYHFFLFYLMISPNLSELRTLALKIRYYEKCKLLFHIMHIATGTVAFAADQPQKYI